MARIGFIFPGQGSQAVGMGAACARASVAARRLFERASELLGYDLGRLCWDGPIETLNLTEHTQPALLTASLAAWTLVREAGIAPAAVAGHSVGEYTALVAAGAVEFDAALPLVRNRGRYMQEAVPPGVGAMAAILGLDADAVAAVCREAAAAGVVSPANLNAPIQIVVAGHKAAVERAMELAKARGAKRTLPLAVSVPSHCALMEPAARKLAADLETVAWRAPEIPVVANVSAQPLASAVEVKQALVAQLASPVRWVESIQRMAADGIDTFIEIGPGTVLSGLVKRIVPDARLFHIEDPESLAATAHALGR